MTTNMAFSGKDGSLLFITTPCAVYYLPVDYHGHRKISFNPFEKHGSISVGKTKKISKKKTFNKPYSL